MEKIAKAVSYILHPLIVPTLGMLVLYNSGTYLSYLPPELKRWILLIVFLLTYVVPLAFIPFFMYQRMMMNLKMESRKERYIPLVVSLLLYGICYTIVGRIPIPETYHIFMLSSVLAVAATLLITLVYRISLHMVGAGGLVALIGFLAFHLKVDLQFYLAVAVLLAGIIGTARMILGAHSQDEVYTGFLTGFAVVLLSLVLI